MCSCQWGYKSKLRFKGQQHRTSVHGLHHICSALRFASQLIWWLEVLWTLLWASMSFEPRLAAGRRVLAAEVKRQRAEATQLSFCYPKTMDEKHICQELWKFRAQQGTDMMNVPINVVLVIPGWTLALRHWRIIPKAWPNPWKLWKLWKPMVSAPTLIARLGTPQPLGLNNSWLWTAYFLWKIGHEIFWNSSCLHRCPQHFCCHTGHKFMLRPGVHFCGLFANGEVQILCNTWQCQHGLSIT